LSLIRIFCPAMVAWFLTRVVANRSETLFV
jgi:hypothetical protein